MNSPTLEDSYVVNLQLAEQQQQRRATHHQKKARPKQPATDSSEKHGVIELNEKLHAYFATGQGRRSYQEDRYQTGIITIANNYSSLKMAQALHNAVIRLGEACQNTESGSTLASFVLHQNFLITAHVGDSAIFLISQDHQNYHCQRLTWDHKPYERSEHQRIVQAGGQVLMFDTWRLNGVLAVSRSFGDAGVGPGLSYIPSMTATTLDSKKTHYVLACTDGITDSLDEIDIAEIFSKSSAIESVPNRLRQEAFQYRSGDNMTVLLVPAKPEATQSCAIVGMVADGHGGNEASEYLKTHLLSTLQALIQTTS